MPLTFMHPLYLLAGCLLYAQFGWAQSLPGPIGGGLLVVNQTDECEIVTRPDSLLRVQDSLEIAMLRTTQTYQQVQRLLKSFPADSRYLGLLPSVLPVDLPIETFRINSPFGLRRHPIHQQARFHGGIDVKAPIGMVVKATADGVVKRVGHDPALGVFVQLQHAFGFETTYGHLTAYCVKPGQVVTRNQELGRVGQRAWQRGPICITP